MYLLARTWMSKLSQAIDQFARVELSPRILIATMIISTLLGVTAILVSGRMILVAAAVLVPWVPVLLAKLRADWKSFGWLAFFELLVVFQIAHFAEHLSQEIELQALSWSPVIAKGIIGDLDIEPVHFWWNTLILLAATLLLIRYRRNRWLLASWLFSIWHEVEHVYIYFSWFLPKGISGHPGILGAGGLVDEANIYIPYVTTLSRADLHFWYNFFEIGLFVIAFIQQAARTITLERAKRPLTRPAWQRAFGFIAAGQVGLITLIGLATLSPSVLNVPQNYTTIQAAINSAPAWSIIRIAPGIYDGPLSISKPVTIVGSGTTSTRIRVSNDETPVVAILGTRGVIIKNLTIQGGLYGIVAEKSKALQVTHTLVEGAWLVGIRLSESAATIEYSQVRNTRSPYGMGIELSNTMFTDMSVIHYDTVDDHPHEGIVIHNSGAIIERNVVRDNGLRGIAVTEMSMAMVKDNQVGGNADAGIFVVDHSMAELENNLIHDVRPGPFGNVDGIRGEYYAELMLGRNIIDAPTGHQVVLHTEAYLEALQ